ncbi:MAG: hypothetical protein IKS25_07695, partial [Oscillospiraceae bacterium]|nr:hypothetical protein [Oscillospiraceae bacterium]
MKKKVMIGLLAVLLVLGLGFGLRQALEAARRNELLTAADAAFAAGDYDAAGALYAQLELPERAADCEKKSFETRLAAAEALLEAGDYSAAREAFRALGDFEDADAHLAACDLCEAKALLDGGNYAEGLALLERSGSAPGAAELLEEGRAALYDEALAATYACRTEEAIALWDGLGDYRDSPLLRLRCEQRRTEAAVGMDAAGFNTIRELSSGTLYWHRLGEVYVPKETGPETRCMVFFPGGYDEVLPNAYMDEFLRKGELPNAIMLFCFANGYHDMPAKIEDCYQVLERAAVESGVFLHDLVLCGASMGAYTACSGAAQLYEEHGLSAAAVLTFDAGGHWEVEDHVLTPEQCDSAARAGTAFLLLEGSGVGMNKYA